ncbi:uncharacterized protein LOC121416757 [Lytechinus variegatus]|uniref:uncharacterized protein LOC121416757 n=1 Tax=Lytechinus variegatus TaxID=7654 RepID=UPI001BB23578|nr:uncharacterized protein LOC121416757 [Lytechinus variegatus]
MCIEPCCPYHLILKGVQSISNSLRIVCGKEREDDEWHPRLTHTLQELKPSQLSNLGIALPYVSTAMRMTTCVTPDPCLNGGTRIVEGGVYRCLCAGDHVGQYCQSCRVNWNMHRPIGKLFYDAFRPLGGKTRLSFKIRGINSFISIKLESDWYAIFGICNGSAIRYATIHMMKDLVWSQNKRSDPLSFRCGTSRFESYWIEKTDSHFQLGLGGNSTPVVEMPWSRQEVIAKIGLSINRDTEWRVDHPCIR